MRIIGLCGPKGAGKNYCAKVAQEILDKRNIKTFAYPRVNVTITSTCIAFADPIKEYLNKVLGIDLKLLYGNDSDKNTYTEYNWEGLPFEIRGERSGKLTVRELMQVFGTELNRDIWGKQVWIKALQRKIASLSSEFDFVFVTDVRFPDEANAIKAWGGEVWGITGRAGSEKIDFHRSEVLIKSVSYDRVIDNSGDPEAQLTALLFPKENNAI